MDMNEMLGLMQRAKAIVARADTSKCTWFYRNKSRQYFTKITSEHGGVMKAYLKDATGDLRAPINGEINGLFFMSKVQFGQPQPQSPFGDTRILIRADILLSLASNVYFADFYCLNRKDHYVTLVLARPGSDADRLCRQRLPKLNIYDKSACPFLFFENGEVHVSSGVMVELFFTEDLEVDQLLTDEFKAKMNYNVSTFGPGRTSQGGRAKHSSCTTCRTGPITTTSSASSYEEFWSMLFCTFSAMNIFSVCHFLTYWRFTENLMVFSWSYFSCSMSGYWRHTVVCPSVHPTCMQCTYGCKSVWRSQSEVPRYRNSSLQLTSINPYRSCPLKLITSGTTKVGAIWRINYYNHTANNWVAGIYTSGIAIVIMLQGYSIQRRTIGCFSAIADFLVCRFCPQL